MTSTDVLVDAFERIRDAVHPAVNGLSLDELTYRPDPESNSIAWLVWHLTRIQDDRVAGLSGRQQVWTANGWVDRFGLPLEPFDTGYGHDPATVATVIADASSLLGYFEDVHSKTLGFVRSLSEADLARVVDRTWDPPETVSTRLVSVMVDDAPILLELQEAHAGNAEALMAALGRIPEDYRRVVVWYQYDRLTFKEIGRRLERSAEAARKLWSRALIRLTEELGPAHDPQE